VIWVAKSKIQNRMTNSPNQTPNPNRRRRLTADELIAILVALTGIGTVFFWGIGQQYRPLNLLQGGIAKFGSDNTNGRVGLLGTDEPIFSQKNTATTSGTQTDRQQNTTVTKTQSAPTTIVKTVEVPAEPTKVTAPTTVIVPPTVVAPAPVTPVAARPAFSDVPKQFWGETYINELRKRGILNDFGGGKFDPNQPVTRGEYAKMLDRAFPDRPIVASPPSTFKDIPANYPRKEAIEKAVKIGFMTGYSPTKFAPNQTIPRYQMQISLAKGLQLPAPANADTVLSKYSDAGDMPKYARDKMAAAVASGLTIKDDTPALLKPAQAATRADAAATVYEALVKEGKIQPQK
jgi:S-layer homology domain